LAERGCEQPGRAKYRSLWKRAGLLGVVLMLILGGGWLLACKSQGTANFPTLATSVPTVTNSQPSGTEQTVPATTRQLTVALPLSQDALKAVRLLFLAKESGLLKQEPGQYIGQQLQIEDLQQFDSDLKIKLESVPLFTGATLMEISVWQASALLPDIIYCQDIAGSLGLDQVLPLDDLLYDNKLLSATHIFASVINGCRVDQ
jgi:hypothetical protein